MTVMFSGQRPGDQLNGLDDLHDEFMEADAGDVLAVVVVRRSKRVLNDEKDDQYPVVRFARVEPITSEKDEKAVRAAMDRAFKARTGQEALDLPEVDE